MSIDWTPMYINVVISNKSRQAIDADYWNALWNLVISQADNNTNGMVNVLEGFDEVDSKMDSILDENGKIQLERLPSSVIGTDPYPVGSVYINVSDTVGPGELFGGTWEPIEDVFLVAQGDSNKDLFALNADSVISSNSMKVYMWKRIA